MKILNLSNYDGSVLVRDLIDAVEKLTPKEIQGHIDQLLACPAGFEEQFDDFNKKFPNCDAVVIGNRLLAYEVGLGVDGTESFNWGIEKLCDVQALLSDNGRDVEVMDLVSARLTKGDNILGAVTGIDRTGCSNRVAHPMEQLYNAARAAYTFFSMDTERLVRPKTIVTTKEDEIESDVVTGTVTTTYPFSKTEIREKFGRHRTDAEVRELADVLAANLECGSEERINEIYRENFNDSYDDMMDDLHKRA